MIKKSCENPHTHYICLFGVRLVFWGWRYIGCYRIGRRK